MTAERGRRVFLWASPLPLLLHYVALWYVGQYDGWGAWTAAPLLLPAIMLSLGMFLTGIAFWYQGRRRRGRDPLLVAATVLAGSVAIFYLFRALARGMLI